jgi:hypothetical protein
MYHNKIAIIIIIMMICKSLEMGAPQPNNGRGLRTRSWSDQADTAC